MSIVQEQEDIHRGHVEPNQLQRPRSKIDNGKSGLFNFGSAKYSYVGVREEETTSKGRQ